MKCAGSSKGRFLLSEAPKNRVQKLILNITTATAWQWKRCMYHNSSSTSWTWMQRRAHLPDTACIKTTQLHNLLQKQNQRMVLLQEKGMWVKAGFQLLEFPWLRNKTISTPQVSPHPDNMAHAEIWRTDLPLAAVRNVPLQQGKISCLESPLDVTAQTKYKLLIAGFLVTLPLHVVPGGTYSRFSVLWA